MAEPTKANPLELVQTQDMLDELRNRFDTMAFAATTAWGQEDYRSHLCFRGDWYQVLGLMSAAKYELLKRWDEDRFDASDDTV